VLAPPTSTLPATPPLTPPPPPLLPTQAVQVQSSAGTSKGL
jgi:hypothetical protein